MENMIPIIGAILLFGFIPALAIGLAMYGIRNRHLEKMGLIKQGIIPPTKTPTKKATPNVYRALRNGFLSIGIALGILVGILITINNHTLQDEYAFFIICGFILLFLGMAYVSFYFVVRNKKDLEQDTDNE